MPRGAAGADPLTYNQTFQPRNPFPIIRYQALAILDRAISVGPCSDIVGTTFSPESQKS